MQVTATINGFANSSNEAAALAVSMTAGDRTNEKAVPLKPMTINAAELAAAVYACKAVHPDHVPLTDLVIKTCNPYLVGVAEKVEKQWKVSPKTNIELVNSVRTSLEMFKSFKVELDQDSELMHGVKAKARALQPA
jgi:ribonuclease HI